jgi:lipoyl(octanoyl) transferase
VSKTELSGAEADSSPTLAFERINLGTGQVDYHSAWELQRQIHREVVVKQRPPTVLFVEHLAVFTAGKRTEEGDRPTDGSRVVEVDRGGRITWHGPGQLVAYPIVPLPHPLDVLAHVRRLETAIQETCSHFEVPTTTVPGRSGVWCVGVPNRKIAAIGVRVSRGTTMHGLSLNVDCDLTWARRIVPCGLPDAGVTTLASELAPRSAPTLIDVADSLETTLKAALLPTLPA